MSREISFLAGSVSSEAGYYQDRQRRHLTKVSAVLPSLAEAEILQEFTHEEILDHLGKDEFLDLIGEEYVRLYFGIEGEGDQP